MTSYLRNYLIKFAMRISVFGIFFYYYLFHRARLEEFITQPFFYRFTPIHIVWAIFMALMLAHLMPNIKILSMARRKVFRTEYEPAEQYDRLELLEYVQRMNLGAWKVMLVWLSCNAVFGALYLTGVIGPQDLLMLTVFYFLCDYICILLFCPFQSFFMHNKCCINCRIYDWGHFMMFTPMLFIKNFYSWSLFFTSCVVLLHWEIVYARYPERFWEGSNQNLRCANCREKTCRYKKVYRKENRRGKTE